MLSHFLRKLVSVAGAPGHAAPCARVTAGALTWHMTPAGTALFGPTGPDVSGWLAAGPGVVKQNRQRTIYRVCLPGGAVYVKHCRANTPRAWAREVLRPAKARLEFENALALRALDVPAVEPLAWGAASTWRPGDSYLITREQDAAEPLVTFLTHTLPGMPASTRSAVRRHVARGLAGLVARLHDAGVVHPDPHPGNFLIEQTPSHVPRFFLADLHDVQFVGRPLSWAETRDNLALLGRWFQVRGSRADRLRGWRAYIGARATLDVAFDADQLAKELEAATLVSNNRFWAVRVKRYRRGDSRDARRVRGPAAAGFAARSLPSEVLQTWLTDPDAAFERPDHVLKDSSTSTVVAVTVPMADGPRAVVYKRFAVRSTVGVVKNLLRPSPGLRSWVLGSSVRDRGLPTAAPLAAFHRHWLGVPLTGYAVFDAVPDAVGLTEAVAALADASPCVRRQALRLWADKLGRLVRDMHEREVAHRDLKAPNVLMAGASIDPRTADPVLIDLVGAQIGRPVTTTKRIRDLARLNTSFLNSAVVSRADRLRFLRAYLVWGLRGRAGWKDWWSRVDIATRAKVAKNERACRPLT